MIVVDLRMWPGGDPERAYPMDRLFIANASRPYPQPDSAYEWWLETTPNMRGMVQHRRSDGPWALVSAVLRDMEDMGAETRFASDPRTAAALKRGRGRVG